MLFGTATASASSLSAAPLALRKPRMQPASRQPLRSLGSAPAHALSGVRAGDRGAHQALFVTASSGAGTGKCGGKGLRCVATLQTAVSSLRIAAITATLPGLPAARSRS